MSLDILKQRLQEALNGSTESNYFKIALEDAQYACSLGSEAALMNWSNSWAMDDTSSLPEDDAEYNRGVKFVADIWDKIKGEEE